MAASLPLTHLGLEVSPKEPRLKPGRGITESSDDEDPSELKVTEAITE